MSNSADAPPLNWSADGRCHACAALGLPEILAAFAQYRTTVAPYYRRASNKAAAPGSPIICNRCNLPKGADSYSPNPRTATGRAPMCKACAAVYQRRMRYVTNEMASLEAKIVAAGVTLAPEQYGEIKAKVMAASAMLHPYGVERDLTATAVERRERANAHRRAYEARRREARAKARERAALASVVGDE